MFLTLQATFGCPNSFPMNLSWGVRRNAAQPNSKFRVRGTSRRTSGRSCRSCRFSHGISTTRAFRIHKIYGDKAIELVQRDP